MYYLLCQMPDGRWGLMVILQDAIDRLWYEASAFMKGDGSRNALTRYLQQFSTKFNGLTRGNNRPGVVRPGQYKGHL